MNVTLLLFLIVVGITLGITAWAANSQLHDAVD